MGDDRSWDDIGFVRRSKMRVKILQQLEGASNPLTPTDIAHRMDKNVNNVSRSISGLRDRDLVKCVNPDAVHMRMYRLTEQGSAVLETVREIQQEQAEYEED